MSGDVRTICQCCKGTSWVQPINYVWDSWRGGVLRETDPPHQCVECYGTGRRALDREDR